MSPKYFVGWTVVQEATSTGDMDLVQLVLDTRDRQRYSARVGGIPELLKKLKDAPDFYVDTTLLGFDQNTWEQELHLHSNGGGHCPVHRDR